MRPAQVARVIGFNLALLLGMLLALEMLLRLAGVRFPAFYQPERERGYGLRPGATGLWTREGRGRVTISPDGLRDRIHDRHPAPGVRRVALLGDSFSEALQVNLEQSWWKRLELRLNRQTPCAFRKGFPAGVEIINFGVGGYGTGQQLLTWRLKARDQRPNTVVLAMYLGNDIQDNTPRPRQDQPVFRLGPDGTLAIDNSFRDSPGSRFRFSALGRGLNRLLNHSALLQLANEAKNRWGGRQPLGRSAPSTPGLHLERDDPSGWALTEALLRQLRDEVTATGAQLLVTSLSTPEQLWPDRGERQAFFRRMGEAPFAREQRLAGLLGALQVPYIPLAEAMREQADQNRLIAHGFQGQQLGVGHWNVTGHRLAAELLARRLCNPEGAP
ncbi:MAG: SGNH/GDSL hydrolase family protein [Cyanobacteriota bacterium]|nr:SGNH/GDSL hydrolase family protein [Cyanobacteriota bacterium]